MSPRTLLLPTALLGLGGAAILATAPGPAAELPSLLVRIALWGSVLLVSAELAGTVARSRLTGLSHLVWDGAAGLGVVMGIVLWFGTVPGLYRPRPLLLLVLALSALAMVARHRRRAAPRDRPRPWPLAGVAVLIAVATLGLIWSRVPSVFFDTLTYHFASPALWLIDGRAQPLAWSLHSWFPPGISLLYGVGLAVAGDTGANDLNLLAGLLLVGLGIDLGRRLFGDVAGVISGLLLATMPIVVHAVGIPAADLAHGMLGFGALAAWLLGRGATGEDATVWRQRSAMFVAGAMLSKYLGWLFPAAVLVVLVAVDAVRARAGARVIVSRVAVLVVPGLILLAPWLVLNQRVAGSPIAPTFASTTALAPEAASAFRAAARGGLPKISDLRELGPHLVTGDDEARFYPQPAWGWLPVALLPATLLWGFEDRRVRWLLVLAGVGLVVWFFTFRWERFLVAQTALLITGLAGALPVLWRRGAAQRAVVVVAVVAGALGFVNALYAVERFTAGSRVAFGGVRSAEFLANIPHEVVYREAGQRLDPRTTRVLVLGEHRHHRLALPHTAPGAYNRAPGLDDLDDYTHLIVDTRRGVPGVDSSDFAAFLDTLGSPLIERGGVALYTLR